MKKHSDSGHVSAPLFPKREFSVLLAAVLIGTTLTACGKIQGNTDSTDGTERTDSTDIADSTLKKGDFFTMDGHISEVIAPMKEAMIDYAGTLFTSIYDTYLTHESTPAAHTVVFSIVPDKNVYLEDTQAYADGRLSHVPTIDYTAMKARLRAGMPWASFVDLQDTLSLDDYYYTDMHWKQESLLDAANTIAGAFGLALTDTYTTVPYATNPFVGSYTANDAADVQSDTLLYLTSDVLSAVTVTDYVNGVPQPGVLYHTDIDADSHTYDLFLSGPMPLQVLESPLASTDRELIIFRDSFGSSIAPYFCEAYAKVTLVDLRYLSSGMLADFISFEGQDVLFLYSTHLINTAMILK
ncbi:MAG: hypothetical protein J6S76_04555 [Clostridia bacterium]|nr:hypothetical protein [Clostridia bacterium]